jgi:hypothetical protein
MNPLDQTERLPATWTGDDEHRPGWSLDRETLAL